MFRSAPYKSLVLACSCMALALMAASQTPQSLPAAYNSNAFINYVRTWQPVKPITDAAQVPLQPVGAVQEATAYIDGLGRPIQTISKQSSPLGKDVVSYVVLDEYGRETIKYLPYAGTATDGYFKTNPFLEQQSFMQATYGSQGETFFYGKTQLDASPLNRPVKEMAPGNSWTGAGRGASKTYMHNDAAETAVKMWKIGSTPGSLPYVTGIYPSGQLTRTGTYDEHNHPVFEYVDKEGRTVLKSVYNNPEWMLTFYVYDDLGQLRCVISPKATYILMADWTMTQTIMDELCFRYEYDHRGRMIEKKVPGAASVYMVYDARDRLVLTQDGLQRAQNKWLFTTYDALNRPVLTGLLESLGSIADQRTAAAGSTTFPNINNFAHEILTEMHYDDYSNLPVNLSSTLVNSGYGNYIYGSYNSSPLYAQPLSASSATRGLVTWTRVKILGGGPGDMLASVNIYDDKGRIIQVQSFNQTGGVDVVTNQYDFSGRLLVSHSMQQKSGTNPLTVHVATRNGYDAQGRLISLEKNLDNTGWKVLSEMTYDEQGQLKTKKLGRKKDVNGSYTNDPLETLTYDYNIRGWMLGANRDYISGTNSLPHFGFELAYDKKTSILGAGTYSKEQYNGNIAGTIWQSAGNGEKRRYDFDYDAANRLMKADFTQNTNGDWNLNAGVNFSVKMGDGVNSSSAYDLNGNILRMQQWGLKLGGSSQIDDLSYGYYSYSNKLAKVTDAHSDANTKLGDFKDGTNQWDDYGYDVNGNMITDLNKGMGSTTGVDMTSGGAITYNHLNLPKLVTVSGKGTIEYVYDAAGSKLKKVATDNSVSGKTITTTTSYIGSAVYESRQTNPADAEDYTDKLLFIGHEEGRIRFEKATTSTCPAQPDRFVYDYFLKDHLGNVRMVLTEQKESICYPSASMEDNRSSLEDVLYTNVSNSRANKPSGYPSDPADPSPAAKVARLKADSQKVGPGIVLKVMAGDKFNVQVSSWYQLNGSSPQAPVSPLLELVNALNWSVGNLPGAKANASELSQGNNFNSGVQQYLGTISQQSSRPKAYLSWILFDEQFRYVGASSGADPVGSDGQFKLHQFNDLPITINGYLYVYVSNETPNLDVFFDNLQVTHIPGPVLEETHYYPFGLTMYGISHKAAAGLDNKYEYNGNELQQNEFSSGSNLDFYDFNARSYDPQTARFMQIDPMSEKGEQESWAPYQFTYDNPIRYSDPDGLCPCLVPILITGAKALIAAGTAYVIVKTNEDAIRNVADEIANLMHDRLKASDSKEQNNSEARPKDNVGTRRKNRLPDKGEPNSVQQNEPGTTAKKYGPDGNVQKEYNKGHKGDKVPENEKDDHIHDYKPNPNDQIGRGKRMLGRPPKKNELLKDFGINGVASYVAEVAKD